MENDHSKPPSHPCGLEFSRHFLYSFPEHIFCQFTDFTLLDTQVIKDYDFDKDGKLNMAEYSQYKSESESEKGSSLPTPPATKEENEKSGGSSSDEVVFVELGGGK